LVFGILRNCPLSSVLSQTKLNILSSLLKFHLLKKPLSVNPLKLLTLLILTLLKSLNYWVSLVNLSVWIVKPSIAPFQGVMLISTYVFLLAKLMLKRSG
jgi:hypothetical protein